jgi:hypothetical protein
VTSVTVSGPTSVPFYGTANLTAIVQGNGSFLPLVTWVLNQGGGSLSATTGANVTYSAPLVMVPTTVVIFAISQSDSTKFGEIDITVQPPPDPVTFFDGSSITGTWINSYNCGIYGCTTNSWPQTLIAAKVDGQHITLTSVMGLAGNLLTVTLSADGTLSWPTQCTIDASGYQDCADAGNGTWDYAGNFSLSYVSQQTTYSGTYFANNTFSGHK